LATVDVIGIDTVTRLGMKVTKDKPSLPLGLNLRSLSSNWPTGLALLALGSAFYYGNELVARFGPINRGVIVRYSAGGSTLGVDEVTSCRLYESRRNNLEEVA
jgi:hypothetical protein